MIQKFLIVIFLHCLALNISAQTSLSLKEKLKNKTWYVIKIFEFHDNLSGISRTTVFSVSEERPYFFSLKADGYRLRTSSAGRTYRFPAELTILNEKLVYYFSSIDGKSQKKEYQVRYSSEDFLEIEDQAGNRFFMVSNHEFE